MSAERLRSLPDWPARMTAEIAALYMGVSMGTFLTRFRAMGVREGGNVLWAREQLDRHIVKQFGLQEFSRLSQQGDTSWDDVR